MDQWLEGEFSHPFAGHPKGWEVSKSNASALSVACQSGTAGFPKAPSAPAKGIPRLFLVCSKAAVLGLAFFLLLV